MSMSKLSYYGRESRKYMAPLGLVDTKILSEEVSSLVALIFLI